LILIKFLHVRYVFVFAVSVAFISVVYCNTYKDISIGILEE